MALKEQIAQDIKTSMLAKDSAKTNALRMVQAAFKNREIELRPNPMPEDEFLAVLKKIVKQRKESIEQFTAANRMDLAEAEQKELTLLETYMPTQMSREKLEAVVMAVIQEKGAKSQKEMGMVMKEVIARTAGAADNKMVSEIVKAKLQA